MYNLSTILASMVAIAVAISVHEFVNLPKCIL